MTVDHYIVFIGARGPLSDQLSSIERRISKSRVIAPAVKKKYSGVTQTAIGKASKKLYDELAREDTPYQQARLYIWMYEPANFEQLELVWKTFGHASWVEKIPARYLHKEKETIEHLEKRLNEIRPLLHEISGATYAQRKSCPLSLPLRNFRSRITEDLRSYWYNELDKNQISGKIKSLKNSYSQLKSRSRNGYKDDKSLIFKPAEDNQCHGKQHPTGSDHKTFFCGRFRYGVSLFPGFHFDVSAEKFSTIRCNLKTASGKIRSISSENREYVNIFPNDYILPEK